MPKPYPDQKSKLAALRERLIIHSRRDGYCLVWTGHTKTGGYGVLSGGERGRLLSAHRASYLAFVGTIPDGMRVLHHCDNPPCIEPSHLHLGSQADNVRECRERGRWRAYDNPAHGEDHASSRLTEHQVIEIRASADSQRTIARRFGISQQHVSDIRRWRVWARVGLGVS